MRSFNKLALASVVVAGLSPLTSFADAMPKSGDTSYTSHYVFIPLGTTELQGVGKAIALDMQGTTENTKGQPFFDKMKASCKAVKIEAGKDSYIEGACAMTDKDGDTVFSTFDTRLLDKNQPDMSCGTHIIKGGTGKYKGISGMEPFACKPVALPAGQPAGAFAIDIPHNTHFEYK